MVATLLPNGAEMIELYLAALQAGWYLVPINHHLVGARDRLHPEGLGRQGVRGPRALRRRLGGGGRRGRASPTWVAWRWVTSTASPPIAATPRLAARRTLPGDRTIGDVMNYTSGTTGNPKGVYRKLLGRHPRGGGARAGRAPVPLRHPAPGRQRPHRRLAALPHRRAALRGARRSTWATPSS